MEAHPVLAADISSALAKVPWSFVMALVSLGLIYVAFHRRPDLFTDLGLSGREVALLTLGSVAGWAINIPLWISGDTYLMANVGGALVPIILVGGWLWRGKLPIIATAIGTALVSYVAWRIVTFNPELGIVSRYPDFFLPVGVALAFALIVSIRKPIRGIPLAYAIGSMGALIGADLMHVRDIHAHFVTSTTHSIISIGGAGVFDMVFLAGASAMALQVVLVLIFGTRGVAPAALPPNDYPGTPIALRDSKRVSTDFERLAHPNPLERALVGVARSDIALRDGEFATSVRMSWLAVDNLLQADAVAKHLGADAPLDVKADLTLLRAAYQDARQRTPTLRQAGEANATAKALVTALAPRAGFRHTLEGVA